MARSLKPSDLLDEAAGKADLQLAIPSICLMEATATIKGRVHEWLELRRRLVAEMVQLERNRTSRGGRTTARPISTKLSLTTRDYIDAIMADFQAVVRRVQATVTLIPLTKPSLKRGFSSIIVEAKHQDLILPDNLILHCVLDHARRQPAASKAFLSGNSLGVLPAGGPGGPQGRGDRQILLRGEKCPGLVSIPARSLTILQERDESARDQECGCDRSRGLRTL